MPIIDARARVSSLLSARGKGSYLPSAITITVVTVNSSPSRVSTFPILGVGVYAHHINRAEE